MPSTGSPNWKRPGSAGGASLSYTDHGAPESTIPTGAQLLTSSREAVHGSTTEKTFCSRMRRAMSCVYCAPKSRMTMDSLSLDWGSTNEFLKSHGSCKGLRLGSPDRNMDRNIAENRLVAVDCGLGWSARGKLPARGRRSRQWRGVSQCLRHFGDANVSCEARNV